VPMVNRWFTDRQKTREIRLMLVFMVCQTVRARIQTSTIRVLVIQEVKMVQVI
jgi:hypothetical protein